MGTKVERHAERHIKYDQRHWDLLRRLREKASKILKVLQENLIEGFIFGSVARGDVSSKSDIDIIIFHPVKVYLLEYILDEHFKIYMREIVQATPMHAIKGYIYLDPQTIITIPLTRLSELEVEFYKFGGIMGYPSLTDFKKRVPGINRKLLLILPTPDGHIEKSVIGREPEASKLLGISQDIIKERVRILLKRDEIGRTGVFLRKVLSEDESFDLVLNKLSNQHPAIRNLIKRRGLVI